MLVDCFQGASELDRGVSDSYNGATPVPMSSISSNEFPIGGVY